MESNIVQPTPRDMEKIATLLAYSSQMALEVGEQALDASLNDLPRLQKLTDIIQQVGSAKQQRLALQALGMSLGQILANQNSNYDWWIIDDEDGRDPCLRYLNTELLVFPQTLISKRVEDGEQFVVEELFTELLTSLNHLVQTKYTS